MDFEQEKRKIFGEISIKELRDFDSNTILDDYEYTEVSLGIWLTLFQIT